MLSIVELAPTSHPIPFSLTEHLAFHPACTYLCILSRVGNYFNSCLSDSVSLTVAPSSSPLLLPLSQFYCKSWSVCEYVYAFRGYIRAKKRERNLKQNSIPLYLGRALDIISMCYGLVVSIYY